MEVRTSDKTLVKSIAALGLCQGLAWVIMSSMCISLYFNGLTPPMNPTSWMETWNYLTYIYFLNENDTGLIHTFLPALFCAFMFIYLFLNAAWILVSLFICIAFHKKHEWIPKGTVGWIVITLLICFLDLTFTIILGVEYKDCVGSPVPGELYLQNGEMCADVVIPVLVIAAKGFILWGVNFICMYGLLTIYYRYKHAKVTGVVHQQGYVY